MTSSLVIAIVYYNGVITTTKHSSMFVSGSPKIVQLDNMLLDALKQAIGNKISLPNDKVVIDIYIFYVLYHLLVIVFSIGMHTAR